MFRRISIPSDLIAKVEEIIKSTKKQKGYQRYRSIAHFVSEAVQLRIEQLEKNRAKEGG